MRSVVAQLKGCVVEIETDVSLSVDEMLDLDGDLAGDAPGEIHRW